MVATTTNLASNETVQTIYITALRNTHALEKQAEQMLERQIERYEHYPEMQQVLRQHHQETLRQIEQLETILHSHGEDRSLFKDAVTQTVGNLGALIHSLADDEILKNLYTNHALENHEVAAYTSLITITETAGHTQHLPVLRQILQEEQNAARQVMAQVEPVTRKYLMLEAQGEKANR
ncbi:MAG TPA: ferritin-like domain-containing protein [Beijerinckiaceae bacterium]|jgi:ferritin-like metal-binding protein YciE